MKKLERNILAIVVIVAVVIVAITITNITNNINKPKDTSFDTNQHKILDEYQYSTRQKFKEEFVDGCIGTSAMEKYCNCAYEKLESEYTLEELSEVYNTFKNGGHPQRFMEVISGCFVFINQT